MNLNNVAGLSNQVQIFTPLPRQKVFMMSLLDDEDIKFAWYCGGFGSGKSYIGAQLAARLAMAAPGGRSLIARQTLVDLKATTMKTFFEVVDRRLIKSHNKTDHLITWINGHETYYWGLDDIEKLKSLEIGWFWIDEVNEVSELTFNILKGRLRHKAQPKRLGFVTSNSEGKNWTYQQFVLGKGLRSATDHAKYICIKAPSTENTYLPEDYLDVLNSYTGDLYERYVRASFNVFEGQIYTDFIRSVHVIKPFAIPENWVKVRGLDHGERNPTACLWAAISPDGDIVIYREYYKENEFVDHHAREIHNLSIGEDIAYTVIDPSTKSQRGKSGKKIDAEYREEMKKLSGKELKLTYANNDVSAGIGRVHRYLRLQPERLHLSTKLKGAPKLYIFDTCPETIDEFEQYKWKKQSPADENDAVEQPRKKKDHTCDALRYIIMSRPDISLGSVLTKRIAEAQARKKDPHDQLLQNAALMNPQDFMKL